MKAKELPLRSMFFSKLSMLGVRLRRVCMIKESIKWSKAEEFLNQLIDLSDGLRTETCPQHIKHLTNTKVILP